MEVTVREQSSLYVIQHTICIWNCARRVYVCIWKGIMLPKCYRSNFIYTIIVGTKSPLGIKKQDSICRNSTKITELSHIITIFCSLSLFLFCFSIQNGDFISVYVDCLWTNSFLVAKHLYSLPVRADVEIARGFQVRFYSF